MINLTLEEPNSINTQRTLIKVALADQKKVVRGGSFLMSLLLVQKLVGVAMVVVVAAALAEALYSFSSVVRASKGEDSNSCTSVIWPAVSVAPSVIFSSL